MRALRLERGLRQEEVAVATGIDRSHLSTVENHSAGISLQSARALAQFYGVSLDWLIEGKGPRRLDRRAEAVLMALDALPDAERETYIRLLIARGSEAAAVT